MESLMMLVGAIVIIPALLIYHSMSWGYVMYKFWYWFLLPVFPNMPHIVFWQAVGLYLFTSFFKNHATTPSIKDEFIESDNSRLMSLLYPWLTILIGLLMLQFIK